MKKQNHILFLAESEIEKAQIVMAVRNDIVDKLQRDAEKIGNMKVDVLGPIVDRIKAEHGLAPAEAFNNTVGQLIDQALTTIMDVKDKISTETLKLTGDIASTTDMSADFGIEEMGGTDLGEPVPEFEMEEEFSEEIPDFSDLPAEPAEREVKESVRLGIDVESTTGRRGKKFFESKQDMRKWLSENKSKIAKVHSLLKESK